MQGFSLSFDHVQSDSFAAPSHVHISIPRATLGLITSFFDTPARTRACEDCLLRRFSQALSHTRHTTSGSGKSGLLSTSTPGAVVLKCSPCEVSDTGCILRFVAGLLAHGRRIDARAAEHMLCDVLPACIDEALVASDELQEEIQATCDLADDQQFIRDELMRLHVVAFVADGSVLPRASGVSLRPLVHARPFTSPAHLRVLLRISHRGEITGMGLPQGVTLIVGGGYHEKSTLLQALQEGVYDHIAGDGREFVLTDG